MFDGRVRTDGPATTSIVRRARPLLGTLVEISVRDAGDPQAAIDAAFAAVGEVHASMSYHDPASDVARLNRHAHRRPVTVCASTFEVLTAALALSSRTRGAFDVSIAPLLERQGLLPKRSRGPAAGTWRDIECGSRRQVRFHRPLRIDLGGIAKGYAVDRACDALRRHGIHSALVNAGGDLRVVGLSSWPIAVRHPAHPGHLLPLCELADGAVATSAAYFLAPKAGARRASALVDGRNRGLRDWRGSVSVTAPNCLVADALTKVVGLLGSGAATLLRREGAVACIIAVDGTARFVGARSGDPAQPQR